MNYLLDTNIVSLVIKQNLKIMHKISAINTREENLFISCITYFEIRRGFLAVDAPKKREKFNKICPIYPMILLDDNLRKNLEKL